VLIVHQSKRTHPKVYQRTFLETVFFHFLVAHGSALANMSESMYHLAKFVAQFAIFSWRSQ